MRKPELNDPPPNKFFGEGRKRAGDRATRDGQEVRRGEMGAGAECRAVVGVVGDRGERSPRRATNQQSIRAVGECCPVTYRPNSNQSAIKVAAGCNRV